MEQFNIVEFETHKVAGEYNRVLEDGTQINQTDYSEGFVEYTIPVKGWFYTYKEFYKNGNLKHSGLFFKKGDYQTGIEIEYDETGAVIKEINHDLPFQLTQDSIFEIIKENGINFSINNRKDAIKRSIVDSKAIWFIDWQIDNYQVGTIDIDDASGKIIKRGTYSIRKN